ncbi:MAG: FixH family protein [Myxococcota bacterium]
MDHPAASAIESPAESPIERRSRRRWTLFIVSFFGLQAVLWAFALSFVHNDASHAVVEDYDHRALHWDEQRAAMQASAALGWQASVDVKRGVAEAPGSIRVALTDGEDQAVQADRVVATLFHQAKAADKQRIELTSAEPGLYVAPASIERPGKWRVHIEARAGSDAYATTQTRIVTAEAPP